MHAPCSWDSPACLMKNYGYDMELLHTERSVNIAEQGLRNVHTTTPATPPCWSSVS